MVRMRWLAIAALLLASCGNSCGNKKSSPPIGDDARSAVVPAAIDAAVPVAVAPSAAPARVPTRVQLRSFRHHLNAGRKLGADDDWNGAVAQFEAALALEPESARALSELGWAALQLDDVDKARSASERSIVLAHDPKLKAASLYNLGRALEGGGDAGGALFAYERSLRLRPNHIVQQRYEALGGDGILRMSAPPCPHSSSKETICACLASSEAVPAERSLCSVGPAGADRELALVTHVALDSDAVRGRKTFFLARRQGERIAIAATLGHGFHGPMSVDDLTIAGVTRSTIAGHDVIRVDARLETGDADTMTIVERSIESRVTFCLADAAALVCPVSVTAAGEWVARLGAAAPTDAEVLGWFREDYKAAPPVTWSYTVGIEVGDDGVVTATSGEGSRTYRASYRLW
jgi:hypothetical protein